MANDDEDNMDGNGAPSLQKVDPSHRETTFIGGNSVESGNLSRNSNMATDNAHDVAQAPPSLVNSTLTVGATVKDHSNKEGGFLSNSKDGEAVDVSDSLNANQASPKNDSRSELASRGSLLDEEDEEDGNTQHDNPGVTNNDTSDGTDAEAGPPSRGARILMNRFSNWRQMANDTVTRNAQVVSSSLRPSRNPTTTGSATDKPSTGAMEESSAVNEQSQEQDVLSHYSPDGDSSSSLEEEGSATDEDYDQSSSDHPKVPPAVKSTHTPTAPIPPPRMTMAAKVAASVVVDTVASGFRGRYSGSGRASPPLQTAATSPAATRKRISTKPIGSPTLPSGLIVQSRATTYMQSILDSLEPHEYVMLLGHGMLGVNLKQTYLRHHGAYVDYLVRGGAAHQSQVICVGDHIVRVGDTDVRRGTILNVPKIIADAKRPVVLVLSTGQLVALERINYIDVAVAMIYNIHKERHDETEQENGGIDSESASIVRDENGFDSSAIPNAVDAANAATDADAKQATPSIERETSGATPVDSSREETVEKETGDSTSFEKPRESPVNHVHKAGIDSDEATQGAPDNGNGDEAGGRDALEDGSNEGSPTDWSIPVHTFETNDSINVVLPPLPVRKAASVHVAKRCNEMFSLSEISQAASSDANFRAALHNAFVTCAVDGRRLPFLSAHFSSEDSFDKDTDSGESSPKATVGTQLMLFLELMSFLELYGVTPVKRRRDLAKRIAYKFFLPSKHGKRIEPPMFDFHHIVPDSNLRTLEEAITDESKSLPRALFVPFQTSVMDALCGPPFISFLISDECARMRAHLRNTAPFLTVFPGSIFDGVGRNASADNHFLYLLVHLICQTERSAGGENDDFVDDCGERVPNSATGLACAVFIKRDIEEAVQNMQDLHQRGSSEATPALACLVSVFEQLWGVFLAPGRMLDGMSSSNEIDDTVCRVRDMLCEAAESYASDVEKTAELLTCSRLNEALDRLATELLYDYVTGPYQKFKEHKFHEWMCREVSMISAEDLTTVVKHDTLIDLPPGCIRRLVRRAELPSGVSAHKPLRGRQNSGEGDASRLPHIEIFGTGIQESNSSEDACCNVTGPYANADFAVVFGIDDGSEVESRVTNPAMDRFDVRRYTCTKVVFDNDERARVVDRKRIPPTLESYATVPSLSGSPFSTEGDLCRVSADGWEVSLVNFMIPNADSSSDQGEHDSALYGVSLVLQQREQDGSTHHLDLELTLETHSSCERPIQDGVRPFTSPVKSVAEDRSENGKLPSKRIRACTVSVSENLPIFNKKLRGTTWMRRLQDRQHAGLVEGRFMVGLALVSSQNTILAMRETLSKLLLDFGRGSYSSRVGEDVFCLPLVELLGNFAHVDVEESALKCILEPYIRYGSSPWLERPFRRQKLEFEERAGQSLVNSLPPIPLALLFVTILMEQKVVFSSSRRSVLFSAVSTITSLLDPLKWSHLLVPLVPSALGRDLLQYPAPYVLGIPTEDPGNMELLNTLPMDVTLVDLDVGRVILAPEFAYDDELLHGAANRAVTASALRSQALYLAQALGARFGSALYPDSWHCDSPHSFAPSRELSDIGKVSNVCRGFVCELLAGIPSCCFWIEERQGSGSTKDTECTVLFDEDRFFHVKNLRALGRFSPLFPPSNSAGKSWGDTLLQHDKGLALSLDSFDLVLESFLRCQSLSTYISSCEKTQMAYYSR